MCDEAASDFSCAEDNGLLLACHMLGLICFELSFGTQPGKRSMERRINFAVQRIHLVHMPAIHGGRMKAICRPSHFAGRSLKVGI